jgi:hypothetical protein
MAHSKLTILIRERKLSAYDFRMELRNGAVKKWPMDIASLIKERLGKCTYCISKSILFFVSTSVKFLTTDGQIKISVDLNACPIGVSSLILV